MSDSPPSSRRFLWVIAGVITLVTAVPLGVIASHSFSDVPDSNIFHDSIDWLADNGITVGCNPPANTQFCPDDSVTREQMAAFLRREAQAFGQVGTQVTDFDQAILIDSSVYVELLSIEVTPKAEATVTLSAHATLERSTSAEGRYELRIFRGGCTGTAVGAGWWRPNMNSEASIEADTISFTGFDIVSADTTYALCGRQQVVSPDATTYFRGLTASWVPTS